MAVREECSHSGQIADLLHVEFDPVPFLQNDVHTVQKMNGSDIESY
jgi:hypothetical protein